MSAKDRKTAFWTMGCIAALLSIVVALWFSGFLEAIVAR